MASLTDILFETVSVGLCLVGPDDAVLRANAEWLRATGFTAEQVVGRDILALFPDTRAMAMSLHARARAGEHVAVPRHEQVVNGRDSWWEGSIDPVPMERGTGLLITAREVSDAVRADRVAEELRQARDRLQNTIESITDGLLVLDRDWRYTYVSARAGQILGLAPESLVGGCVWELFPRARGTKFYEEYHRAVVTGRPVEFEEFYPDPLNQWLECHAYPSAEGLTVYFRDVTERRRAEQALRDSEIRFRALADSIPQLAWTARSDGFLTWYNRRWYEYTGCTPDEMQGWGWRRVHAPERLPAVIERWKTSLETGTALEMEFPLRRADGVYRHFLTRVIPLKDEQGTVLQWFGTNTDVTELVEAREALQDAARKKDEFLAMLSHELRNPLAPIRNSVHVLRRAPPESDQGRRAREIIERQTEHLARLVDDLLDVTRIARGRIDVRPERIDLREVVRRTAEDFRRIIEQKGVTFEVTLADAPLWADADATRLTQALGNLLHNAAKYTRTGDRVYLSVAAGDGLAEIRVRDSGAGIDPALLPTLFQPFVQAQRTLARSDGGLGLGLALVRGIAELHGGTVEAHSAGKGHGAEFVVRLPLAAG